MKILILSDSHSSLSFMRCCIQRLHPDAIVHLGDHYEDGQSIAEENPQLPLYQVAGNCDRYRCPPGTAWSLLLKFAGVSIYMTHGHMHNVKQSLSALLSDARSAGAQLVLYGHTHRADCHQEPDGIWVLNPGAANYGGSAGLVEIQNGSVVCCKIYTYRDLEEMQ